MSPESVINTLRFYAEIAPNTQNSGIAYRELTKAIQDQRSELAATIINYISELQGREVALRIMELLREDAEAKGSEVDNVEEDDGAEVDTQVCFGCGNSVSHCVCDELDELEDDEDEEDEEDPDEDDGFDADEDDDTEFWNMDSDEDDEDDEESDPMSEEEVEELYQEQRTSKTKPQSATSAFDDLEGSLRQGIEEWSEDNDTDVDLSDTFEEDDDDDLSEIMNLVPGNGEVIEEMSNGGVRRQVGGETVTDFSALGQVKPKKVAKPKKAVSVAPAKPKKIKKAKRKTKK